MLSGKDCTVFGAAKGDESVEISCFSPIGTNLDVLYGFWIPEGLPEGLPHFLEVGFLEGQIADEDLAISVGVLTVLIFHEW